MHCLTRHHSKMTVLDINDKEVFDKAIAEAGDKLVIIDFYATWCGPCRIMGPKFHKMADELTGNIYIKVDVDEGEDIVNTFDIKVMPTFVFIKNGKTIATIEGNNYDKLHEAAKQHGA
uniref:Thioredoxin n=1 Tax=Panagrellus redivivus TaxID=6233 RepID=A0A7E4V9V5_PANRE